MLDPASSVRAFGEKADRTRNILAAGGGTIAWEGQRCPVVEAGMVDVEEAGSASNGMQQAIMRSAGIERFLPVRDSRQRDGVGSATTASVPRRSRAR